MLANSSYHEGINLCADEIKVSFQGKMSCINDVFFYRRQISLVWMCTGGRKNVVTFAPDYECGGLVFTKQFLPTRIFGHISAIAQEHLQLNVFVPRAIEQVLVMVPIIRADQLESVIGNTMRPLPFGRVNGQQ